MKGLEKKALSKDIFITHLVHFGGLSYLETFYFLF